MCQSIWLKRIYIINIILAILCSYNGKSNSSPHLMIIYQSATNQKNVEYFWARLISNSLYFSEKNGTQKIVRRCLKSAARRRV